MFVDVCVSHVGGHNLFCAQCVTFQAYFLWEKDFGISSVVGVTRLYTQSAITC